MKKDCQKLENVEKNLTKKLFDKFRLNLLILNGKNEMIEK
jgi:hypothetical protein